MEITQRKAQNIEISKQKSQKIETKKSKSWISFQGYSAHTLVMSFCYQLDTQSHEITDNLLQLTLSLHLSVKITSFSNSDLFQLLQ